MPPVHHQTFKLADMPQARLLVLGDEIQREIKDVKVVSDVDATGHLIASAFQLLSQAEFAGLINSSEALSYSKQIVDYASGAQEAQTFAPVDGDPSETVTSINRQLIGIMRTILNKISGLKTKLALQQFETAIAKKESEGSK